MLNATLRAGRAATPAAAPGLCSSVQRPAPHRRRPAARCCSQPDDVRSEGSRPEGVVTLQQRLQGAAQAVEAFVMPRERGDARDWALMSTAVCAYVMIAANLYNLYAMWYYSSGLRPLFAAFRGCSKGLW